ncbi:thioredoxin domain-containing protein [Nocardia sp. CDC159]|uniref:Thioredoxin domain-containing protein n=1 Tax=Nocardia pulmonis TaxID=2951408 RepID=A0A9X2EA14_9NOCA|nr:MULTISPECIES: thioredoxin domain-containing protein [Nocardia]MCM6777072.1 thioredoxin domain-containing protein [Nocardia pulmonis]MCM6789957.1 thioredoxin domain-containing protein [Nocardia sp. CDC159]
MCHPERVNLLGDATSPYLRQHADNPVHWRPWDAAALAAARERDVPILLSVGYASCHWCHVMAHESFEDEATAALMNENFVCVKVDREERPDLDAVYMNATVAMTGQGGWPMTCFLTPGGEPFYCGTYYPKVPRGGMPSFTQLLAAVTDTWRNRRDEVNQAAGQVAEALRAQSGGLPEGEIAVGPELLAHGVATVLRDVDQRYGGFGGAPKFPPSALLEALLRHYERTGDAQVLQVVSGTAEAMARGGIYDQLRGGFARYSVDAAWVVPHFEKMLYDNAQLLRAYAHLARRVADPALALRVTEETAEFLLDDLATATGGFASALDADTHIEPNAPGVEGATYVWTPAELTAELGPIEGAWAAEVFGVTTAGTFEHGTSVLTRYRDPEDGARLATVRDALRQARSRRPQPDRDDKVVTAWNGMAITALAEAGAAHGRADWVDAAIRCARFLLREHVSGDRVVRASLGGVAGAAPGVLEDYAWLATGLLALYQATGEPDWLTHAQHLIDSAATHFADPADPGSWFDTADDAETLVTRPRDPLDGATPSGASAFAETLLTASVLSDPDRAVRYGELAARTLARGAIVLARAPRSGGQWLAVAEAAVRGPVQIAIALPGRGEPARAQRDSVAASGIHAAPGDGSRTAASAAAGAEPPVAVEPEQDRNGGAAAPARPAESASGAELVATARWFAPGGAVIVAGVKDSAPLLVDRPPVGGRPAAYVCRGSVCDLPVTDAGELRAALLRV